MIVEGRDVPVVVKDNTQFPEGEFPFVISADLCYAVRQTCEAVELGPSSPTYPVLTETMAPEVARDTFVRALSVRGRSGTSPRIGCAWSSCEANSAMTTSSTATR